MSAADAGLAPAAPAAGGGLAAAPRPSPVAAWFRLLGSELGLIFRRRRNQALLAVLFVLPVLLGVVLRLTARRGGGGGSNDPNASLLNQLAGNGIFLAFLALTILLILVLPLVVSVVAGDSVAGEAGSGTIRYLLAVPAGRTRLLAVKYAAVVLFGLAACAIVVGASLAAGAVLFPIGPVTLLSGTTVPLSEGLLRVLFVTLYVAAGMGALGAIGLAISTFTEHAIGAIAAVLVLAVASEVADNVPQISAAHPFLPTHWLLSFDAVLRSPIATSELLHGLLSFGVYAVIFVAIAWARFTTADITS